MYLRHSQRKNQIQDNVFPFDPLAVNSHVVRFSDPPWIDVWFNLILSEEKKKVSKLHMKWNRIRWTCMVRKEKKLLLMCRYIPKKISFAFSVPNHFSHRGSRPFRYVIFFCFSLFRRVAVVQPSAQTKEMRGILYENLQITVDYIINLTIKCKNLVITR